MLLLSYINSDTVVLRKNMSIEPNKESRDKTILKMTKKKKKKVLQRPKERTFLISDVESTGYP